MNLIATGTVIRGKGECQAFVNGVAQMDIRRQQEQWRAVAAAEIEQLRMAEKGRNRMAAEVLRMKRRAWEDAPGMLEYVRERITDVWALVFGTVISWGELMGLWEYEDEPAA